MKGNKSYSESLKREVVHAVQLGILSKEEARKKYDIRSHSAILKWIRTFEEQASMSKREVMDYKKTSKEALIKLIKELERQLEDEKIRAEGYSKMIDIAEEQLKISIRKKYITKQSKQ
jgi:transposase-like protein